MELTMRKFKEINILEIANEIQITGMILTKGKHLHYFAMLPGEFPHEDDEVELLEMDLKDWEDFLHQSDVQNIAVAAGKNLKAIIRKTQRQIDVNVSWAVYERDEYRCRYCHRKAPLTVDHIVP